MNAQLSKGRAGWEARTSIELDNGRWLDIATSKGNGGLRARAQCYRVENGFITYALFQDYSATILAHPARCTEKAVIDLHREALRRLDQIKAEVAAFYAAKGE
jgi:hypothetical protein